MKILLLDAAFSAAPIYEGLIERGHDVWLMGNRPDDLLAKKAKARWINQDYSEINGVEAHVTRLGIERVVPGCTDVSFDTCSRLTVSVTVLDGPKTNYILSNKVAFRRLCAELDLPSPRILEKKNFPLLGKYICKPADAYSGRGITIFDGANLDELNTAYGLAIKASPTATALIENFVTGDLYSCSAFIEKQKIVTRFYVREGSSANPFAVDTSYVAYDLPASCINLLENSIEKICSSLQLKDGLLHTQFILTKGHPFIVEVCRRCPGDLYSLLIEYSTGFQYASKYASYFVGAVDAREDARKYILRHTVSSTKDSTFAGLQFAYPLLTRAYFPICAIGQMLFSRQGNRAGILFSVALGYDQLIEDFNHFINREIYRTT